MSAMATLLIRNLDDAIAERLRAQARRKGISVEEEVRRIITHSTMLTQDEVLRSVDEIRARSKPTAVRSADLIREDRDR